MERGLEKRDRQSTLEVFNKDHTVRFSDDQKELIGVDYGSLRMNTNALVKYANILPFQTGSVSKRR